MQCNRILSLVSALALASATLVASAGRRDVIPVEITDRYAQGSINDARSSADNMQVIGCYTGEYHGLCYAVDAAGLARGCSTRDPEQLAVLRSISSDSIIVFYWDKEGICSHVSIGNYSVYRSAATAGY